jgi:hypothetical protein
MEDDRVDSNKCLDSNAWLANSKRLCMPREFEWLRSESNQKLYCPITLQITGERADLVLVVVSSSLRPYLGAVAAC